MPVETNAREETGMTEPHFMTIAEASSAIRARTLSPVELTQSFLNRIKVLDGQLDAYLMVLEETALATAKQAEQEIMAGRWKGPGHRGNSRCRAWPSVHTAVV